MVWQLLLWLVLRVPSIYPLVKMFASWDLIVTLLRVPSIDLLVKMFASRDLGKNWDISYCETNQLSINLFESLLLGV